MDIENMTNDDIWKAIEWKAAQHPDKLENVNAVYAVHLTGEVEATYTVAFKKGEVKINELHPQEADCTLTISFKHFKKLLKGNLNATTAFMTGKIKVKGNIALALKLEQVLKSFSL